MVAAASSRDTLWTMPTEPVYRESAAPPDPYLAGWAKYRRNRRRLWVAYAFSAAGVFVFIPAFVLLHVLVSALREGGPRATPPR